MAKTRFWIFWLTQKQQKTRENLFFPSSFSTFFLLFAADPQISVSVTVDENCYLYKTSDTTGYPRPGTYLGEFALEESPASKPT